MKRRKPSKCTINRIFHVKNNLWTRYGLVASNKDLKEMVSQIHRRQAQYLVKLTRSKKVYVVEFCDQRVCVIYSCIHKILITALPEECISKYSPEENNGEKEKEPLNASRLRKAVFEIQNNRALHVRKISNRYSEKEISFRGEQRRVIYDRKMKVAIDADDFEHSTYEAECA